MSLSKYYSEICKQPMLTTQEERDLFTKYISPDVSEKEKDSIRDTIISANMRFVFKQAKNNSDGDIDLFQELISAGNEGLLIGFQKYNPESGVKFLTYAGWWVIQRILHAMSKVRIVSLPVWKQQLSTRIERMREFNENLTLTELMAEFPDVKPRYIKELWETRYLTYYIQDMAEQEFPIDPIGDEVDARLDNQRIAAVVDSLPDMHRQVIEGMFGLKTDEEETSTEICYRLNISKENFRRLKTEAFAILKDKLNVD